MCELCAAKAGAPRIARRNFLRLAGITAGLAIAPRAFAKETKAPPKPENVLSPDAALDQLMKGNARYIDGVTKRHDFKHEREVLSKGQNPFAAVLSCADSRIAPEFCFDSARGDIFVCRVAGNFATDEIVASFEYAVQVLNTPLIMVLGHQACGAVDAVIEPAETREQVVRALLAERRRACDGDTGMVSAPSTGAARTASRASRQMPRPADPNNVYRLKTAPEGAQP